MSCMCTLLPGAALDFMLLVTMELLVVACESMVTMQRLHAIMC
jgi:hypothetical protein